LPLSFPEGLNHFANIGELLVRRRFGGQSAENKTSRRAFEGALQQVARDLLLGCSLGKDGS
jgi:hypothetical protein